MKKILIMLSGICVFAMCLQQSQLGRLKEERDKYKGNTETLLGEVERYKTSDSLSVVRINALRLTMDELERYRKEDAELIASLKMKGREAKAVSSASTAFSQSVETLIRDTIIERDTTQIVAHCIDYTDAWLDLHGCAEADTFRGDICVRDTLYIIEAIKRKRFLGFLWRTKKVKERTYDFVTRNPYTEIEKARVVTIE